jgi:hypothetical protein
MARLPPLPFKSQLAGPDGLITQWWADFFEKVIKKNTETITTERLDDDGVTFAKMQNIATDRLIGRDTAASGDPEELTVGGGVEFSGSGGIQRSALTGDVTASAGSNATTIANGVVSFAKMVSSEWTSDKNVAGYMKLPNGFIIQWATNGSLSATTTSVTFEVAFPTACLLVIPWIRNISASATTATGHVGSGNLSTTGFDLYNRTSITLDLAWLAVGY